MAASMIETAPLAPCPFCGGEVELIHDHTTEDIDRIKHKVPTPVCPINGASGFSIGNDQLVTAWNSRPSPPASAVPPEVDALIHKSMPRDFERRYDLDALVSADLVEVAAAAAANDEHSREIAGREFAPQFDDMDPETQEYWRCVVRAVTPLIAAQAREDALEAIDSPPWLPSTLDQYDRFASEYRDWQTKFRALKGLQT